MNRADILQYFLENYFGNDRHLLAEATGYTMNQVESWLDGEWRIPGTRSNCPGNRLNFF